MNNQTSLEEEQQKFYEFLTDYPCFSNGQLDLYAFSVYFALALDLDGIKPPEPHVIANLFLEHMYETPNGRANCRELVIRDMDESQRYIYPHGTSIALHISSVSFCIHNFVFDFGNRLLSKKPNHEVPYFAFWLVSENVYTYALLNRLFSEIRRIISEIDKSGSLKAQLQNMNLTKGMELGITDNLLVKNDISEIAIERISKAITEGYFLEAITLQESIISDRLALFLHHQGDSSDSKTLNKLILTVQRHHQNKLFEEVDLWRVKRNKAIHGLVRSSPFEKQIGLLSFDKLAKETATDGKKLVLDIINWFDEYVYEQLNPFNITPYDKYAGTKERLNS